MFADFFTLPYQLLLPIVFLFGIIIGSFLNVVIYRFHTGKSLGGSSHCLSCNKPLGPLELLPLLSYLALRGRCHGCGSYIPPRYMVVEALTGLLFVWVVLAVTNPLFIFFSCALMAVLVVVLVYDIIHMVIPDSLTLTLGGCALVYLGYHYVYTNWSLTELGSVLLGAAAASGFLFILWFVSKGAWLGFGDVKLVFPLALMAGPQAVFSMVVLSFWVGALIGLVLIGHQRLISRGQPHLRFLSRPYTMKSEVPFAPFLIAGFLLVFLGGIDVLALISYVVAV